jgi:hypothetical protein
MKRSASRGATVGETRDRTPTGIEVGIAGAAVVSAVALAAAMPAAAGDWRLAPVMAALFAVAARTVSLPGLGLVVLIGYFLVDGFLVNRFGQVTWTGTPDAYRLLMVVAAVAAGLMLGGWLRWRRRQRRLFLPPDWIAVVAPGRRGGVGTERV